MAPSPTGCQQALVWIDKGTAAVTAKVLIPGDNSQLNHNDALDCHGPLAGRCFLAFGASGVGMLETASADSCDSTPTANVTPIGGAGNRYDAMALNLANGALYGVQGSQFGSIDRTNGAFTPIGAGLGTGMGSVGSVTFGSVDKLLSMTWDPATSSFYASQDRNAGNSPSLLVRINPATGALIPGAFGGADYRAVTPLGGRAEASGIVVVGSKLYATMNQADTDSHLVTLDPATGVPTDIGADGVPKIRSLTADSSGRLLGLTGSAGAFLALIPCPLPHSTLTVNAAPNTGVAPLTTSFTYNETNDGARPISGVEITDDTCSPLTFSGGDTNGNGILDPGETWTYSCTHVFAAAGTFTSHIVAMGVDTLANQPAPQQTAEVTVTARVGAHTTLTVKANPSSGTLPLTTTYTYREVNDGGDPISGVKITDDTCSPLTFTGGDTNGNGILDPGEMWTYTCTRTITVAGTIMSHVVARGTNIVDQLAAPDVQASTAVTVSGASPPKPAPAPSVLGLQEKKQPALPVTGLRLPVLPLSLLGVGLLVAGAAMRRRSGVRGRTSGR